MFGLLICRCKDTKMDEDGFSLSLSAIKVYTMIRFGNAIVLGLCGLFCGYLEAQPLQKFTGTLANGFTDPGEMTYSYRPDPKTGEHIRQGAFRYSLKSKDELQRFSHNITGAYAGNLKEGLWSYKINQKDFMLQEKGRYTSGTVSLDALYKGGLPDGKWRFESVLKSRSGEKGKDKWVWGKQDSAKTVILELNFNLGVLTGDFYARDDKFVEIKGKFDEKGFFDGEWEWKFIDSTITYVWDKGILLKSVVTNQEGNILHQEEQTYLLTQINSLAEAIAERGVAAIKDFSFRTDTANFLGDSEYFLTRLFKRTLYEPRYFLYTQIPGDRAFYYDNQSYRMQYHIKGMYHIKVKSSLTPNEVKHYRQMEDAISRMESQTGYLYLMNREGKLKKEAMEGFKLMESNISLSRKYSCAADLLKYTTDLNKALASVETGCSSFAVKMEELPAFKTREEALQYMAAQVTKLELENQKLYVNIRKHLAK